MIFFFFGLVDSVVIDKLPGPGPNIGFKTGLQMIGGGGGIVAATNSGCCCCCTGCGGGGAGEDEDNTNCEVVVVGSPLVSATDDFAATILIVGMDAKAAASAGEC